jgi:putative transposase
MNFEAGSTYHVFTRGNNQQLVFFTRDNYLFFLRKIRKEIYPVADILAYCLMPNHFHLMIVAKEFPNELIHPLARKIGTVLSSYTRAINVQENRSGSLFQQKAKAIVISSNDDYHDKTDYLTTCFHYIHQNPMKAGLVNKMEDWEFSSFRDYAGLRDGSLINAFLAKEILEVDWENFYEESYNITDEDVIKSII